MTAVANLVGKLLQWVSISRNLMCKFSTKWAESGSNIGKKDKQWLVAAKEEAPAYKHAKLHIFLNIYSVCEEY